MHLTNALAYMDLRIVKCYDATRIDKSTRVCYVEMTPYTPAATTGY